MNPNYDTYLYWMVPSKIDGRSLVFAAVYDAASSAGFSKK